MRSLIGLSSLVGMVGCAATTAGEPAPAPQAQAQPVVVVAPAPAVAASNPSVIGEFPPTPQPSPAASVSQTVGITDIRVAYSSPGVKGRKVFGELVPFGEPWRTGANAPTTIELSRDVTIGGQSVPAGRYSIFTVPNTDKWKVILNKDPEGKGVFEHDARFDVAVVEVAPEEVPARERLAFSFFNTTDSGTELALEWDNVRVRLPIDVNTDQHVAQVMNETFQYAWRPMFTAARHYASKGDVERAVTLFEQSIAVQPTFWNHFFLATTLEKKGDAEGAKKHAALAIELGKDEPVFDRAFRQRAEELASGSTKAPAEG